MSAEERDRPPCAQFVATFVALIRAGQWKPAVVLARGWYVSRCPRYRRDEVEVCLNWVGTACIIWDQYQARTRLPAADRNYMTRDQAEAELLADVARHFENAAGTYRRTCERIDTWPGAEEKVAQTVRRIEIRNGSHLDPPPSSVPLDAMPGDEPPYVVVSPGGEHRTPPLYAPPPYPADMETPPSAGLPCPAPPGD